jgi:hypothetical protein
MKSAAAAPLVMATTAMIQPQATSALDSQDYEWCFEKLNRVSDFKRACNGRWSRGHLVFVP